MVEAIRLGNQAVFLEEAMSFQWVIFGAILLIGAILLVRRRLLRSRQRPLVRTSSIRVFEPGGDPIKDRIEFHLRN